MEARGTSRARASRRSRCATTACSGTTSRSRNRICTRSRTTTSASRRSLAANASSRPASRRSKRRCSRPTSASRANSRSSRRCARAWSPRQGRVHRRRRSGAGDRSTRSPDSPTRRPSPTSPSRGARRRRDRPHLTMRHPGRRATVGGGNFVPNDVTLDRGQPVDHAHRPEHGRQVDVSAPDGAAVTCSRRPDRSCRRGSAKLGVVDRIFARVGASDNIARGPVDLHGRDAGDRGHPATGATSRSLVILDEIGRGTEHVRRPEHRVGRGRASGDE
jgi:hypothetical protein